MVRVAETPRRVHMNKRRTPKGRFFNNFLNYSCMNQASTTEVEKAREIDPFGHAGLTPLGKIRLTLAGEIKMTPVEASAGEFFCSFETPCPGTARINLKNYRI